MTFCQLNFPLVEKKINVSDFFWFYLPVPKLRNVSLPGLCPHSPWHAVISLKRPFDFKYILYNGKKVIATAVGTKGGQKSIFNDEIEEIEEVFPGQIDNILLTHFTEPDQTFPPRRPCMRWGIRNGWSGMRRPGAR